MLVQFADLGASFFAIFDYYIIKWRYAFIIVHDCYITVFHCPIAFPAYMADFRSWPFAMLFVCQLLHQVPNGQILYACLSHT